MISVLLVIAVIVAGVFGYEAFRAHMARKPPPPKVPLQTVSTTRAEYQEWQPEVNAVGQLSPVLGVEVTTQIAGLVQSVQFQSGDMVKAGQLLVQLNVDPDVASLHSLEAQAEQAQVVYDRDQKQLAIQAISQATLDADAADLKSRRALAAQQAALVAEKSIAAPFAGRLGITTVKPGQYLNPGDQIVPLQSLDPIYADFYVPQQDLARLSVGQPISVSTDTYPDRSFAGKITAINPTVDTATRNFLVEGTLPNPKDELLPGMFVSVTVLSGAPERFLTLPKTVVTYSSYGDTVFIVKPGKETDPTGKPVLTASQVFVTVGRSRGDQIAILKGVQEGDEVVSAGQLKLRGTWRWSGADSGRGRTRVQ